MPLEGFYQNISQHSKENNCVKSPLIKVAGPKACNFIKKRLQHMFSCEY